MPPFSERDAKLMQKLGEHTAAIEAQRNTCTMTTTEIKEAIRDGRQDSRETREAVARIEASLVALAKTQKTYASAVATGIAAVITLAINGIFMFVEWLKG